MANSQREQQSTEQSKNRKWSRTLQDIKSYKIKKNIRESVLSRLADKREWREWKVSLQFLDQAVDLELPSDLLVLAF